VLATGIDSARIGTAISGRPTPSAPLENPPRKRPARAIANPTPDGKNSLPHTQNTHHHLKDVHSNLIKMSTTH
jgi:hypothetical protein